MKRFMLFIAMVGFVATSCSKTIVKDEVETAISFSTESSKLTRAIVQGDVYGDAQPFGVFAYAHQGNGSDKLMDTVQVAKTGNDWKSKVGKYYWPNDPTTSIDFYAYSPVINVNNDVALADHQKMTVTNFAQADNGSMSFSAYTHSNMYVDFMVATPVKGATYVNPDGSINPTNGEPNVDDDNDGVVPVVFKHQMSQIVFKVTTKEDYGDDVHIAVQRIELHNILNTASYVQDYSDEYGAWTTDNNTKYDYTQTPVFPASADNGAAATDVFNHTYSSAQDAQPDGYEIDATTGLTTKGVTMIPQNMNKATTPVVLGKDDLANEETGQMFKIVYSINGNGVASEVVTKHIPFYAKEVVDAGTIVNWVPNKKITYNVVIGLNEITFEPSVTAWEDTAGNEYSFVQ